jgi:hypothetical protein
MNESTTARNLRIMDEVSNLYAEGYSLSEILVNIDINSGEACWGDACALPSEEMETAMEEIGYKTEKMMDGDRWVEYYKKAMYPQHY